MKIHEVLYKITQVEGWLSYLEQIALFHLPVMADNLKGALVEIGSYKGKSTVALGLGSKWYSRQKRKIISIDPFKNLYSPDGSIYENYYETFLKNINEHDLKDYVEITKKLSTEAHDDCPKEIAVLFIDGDHSYEGVKHDIKHYSPRIVQSGFIAFHDYGSWPGVTQAVDELLEKKEFELICTYDNLCLVRKL